MMAMEVERAMSVQEVIDELMAVEDKTLPMYGWDVNTGNRTPITLVDVMDDNVDMNLG